MTSRGENLDVAPAEHFESAPSTGDSRAASNDNCATDILLDQYHTRPDIAEHLYAVFRKHLDPSAFRMVEPSAGKGAFFKLLPPGSLGYDVEPKYPGIRTADFLTVQIGSEQEVAIVGNPPFGRNASKAVRFFNHAAPQSSVIAFILPRSFRKASITNRLNFSFHLIHEEEVPEDAFLFRGKPYSVPAVFQIWCRRGEPRKLRRVEPPIRTSSSLRRIAPTSPSSASERKQAGCVTTWPRARRPTISSRAC